MRQNRRTVFFRKEGENRMILQNRGKVEKFAENSLFTGQFFCLKTKNNTTFTSLVAANKFILHLVL
jgi:hypothetical protein